MTKKTNPYTKAYNDVPAEFRSYFKPATQEDADYVAAHMSAFHKKEINLIEPKNPQEACNNGLEMSKELCFSLIDPETQEVLGLGGICEKTTVWLMLCENGLSNARLHTFLTQKVKGFLNWLLESEYTGDFIENIAAPDAKEQLRWLEWLGATTLDAKFQDIPLKAFVFSKASSTTTTTDKE